MNCFLLLIMIIIIHNYILILHLLEMRRDVEYFERFIGIRIRILAAIRRCVAPSHHRRCFPLRLVVGMILWHGERDHLCASRPSCGSLNLRTDGGRKGGQHSGINGRPIERERNTR